MQGLLEQPSSLLDLPLQQKGGFHCEINPAVTSLLCAFILKGFIRRARGYELQGFEHLGIHNALRLINDLLDERLLQLKSRLEFSRFDIVDAESACDDFLRLL